MKDVYQSITDHILSAVDDAGNWRPCWHGMSNGHPMNATSGHYYKGVNILTCWVAQMVHHYPTQAWASYKQWQAAGAQVKKGERGTPIIFYKQLSSEDPDDNGRILVRASHIFNAAQVEGWEQPVEVHPITAEQRIEHIETWVAGVRQQAMITETTEGMAYYRPSTDQIVMPEFTRFIDPEHYYAVLFHELTHWTGAKHRLDREFRRERSEYAKEELVAELGAAFLAADFGIISETRDDHTTYLASWLKALKDDKRLIVRAASLASKAADYLHQAAVPAQIEEAA
jgi:antirestriction protein ArdC